IEDEDEQHQLTNQLGIIKFSIDQKRGSVDFSATGVVSGRIKDQFAYHEVANENTLVVATTSGTLNGQGSDEARNHLFALEQRGSKLVKRSAIRDFGENEDIRSIRYIDDIAYVVTFRKTDPLFAFDLSNLDDITFMGELKVPGFSLYLHPIKDNFLIGVGYEAEETNDSNVALYDGVNISLFDIADPTALKRVDNKVHGSRGAS